MAGLLSLPSGFQANATHDTPLLFNISGLNSFTPNASSTVTQVERDIALILDRSGSMSLFEGQNTAPGQGEAFLFTQIRALFDNPANGITEEEYLLAVAGNSGDPAAADLRISDREYSDKILNLLSGDLKEFAQTVNSDYRPGIAAPRFSRWHSLEVGYQAFFEVLDATDQDELVSVSSFSSGARLDVDLTDNYDTARSIAAEIRPDGSTAIGDGLLEGFDSLNIPTARLGAIKTLIVLSDGQNRTGTPPIDAANQIIAENPNVIINTVTFGAGADVAEMQTVANIGSGKHFHASNADQLTEVFRELAASQRTLITD